MLKDTLGHAQLSIFTEIATLVLVAVFAGAFLYAFVWRAKASWKAVAELPLHDDAPAQAPVQDRAAPEGASDEAAQSERSAR